MWRIIRSLEPSFACFQASLVRISSLKKSGNFDTFSDVLWHKTTFRAYKREEYCSNYHHWLCDHDFQSILPSQQVRLSRIFAKKIQNSIVKNGRNWRITGSNLHPELHDAVFFLSVSYKTTLSGKFIHRKINFVSQILTFFRQDPCSRTQSNHLIPSLQLKKSSTQPSSYSHYVL